MTGSRLVVDLSNKSAQLIIPSGKSLMAWSDVTRRAAAERANQYGWIIAGKWEHTSPPDGFQCPVRLSSGGALLMLTDTEQDVAEVFELVAEAVPNTHDAHNDLRLARDAFVEAFMRLRRALAAEDTPWKVRHS